MSTADSDGVKTGVKWFQLSTADSDSPDSADSDGVKTSVKTGVKTGVKWF